MGRRVLAYLVLVACVAGVLYSLRSPSLEVHLLIDLSGAATLGGLPLRRIDVTVLDDEGRFVASTEHSFPAELYPSGPPAETLPAVMELRRADFEVAMKLHYGDADPPLQREKRVVVPVRERGEIRVAAGGN
jgi:hypothetical protein